MAIGKEIKYAGIDKLSLDPKNPRLGRSKTSLPLKQDKILDLMRNWTLDELAVSFLESGFWLQEALLVVKEKLYGKKCLVVVEGNRRLAALKYLKDAIEGSPISRKWAEIAKIKEPPTELFESIPYIEVDSRKDIEAFLGFRHFTGIKEWKPAEKAEYIVKLIEESHMTYEEVMRKIGSKTNTARQNYIAYHLLLQMEEQEDISIEKVEEKFSVLYLSLRTAGVQQYLQIDIKADPTAARHPVPEGRIKAKVLANFALWLFGDEKRPPLFTDSRRVNDFGIILESQEAVEYLERTEIPNFETALRLAGGDEPELIKYVERAADNVELALTTVHRHTQSEKLQPVVRRFGADARQLLSLFPQIQADLSRDEK